MTKIEIERVGYQELIEDVKNIVTEAIKTILEERENKQDSLFTRKQAASILKVTEQTIDNYRKKGKLASLVVGGNIRFRKADIMNLLS